MTIPSMVIEINERTFKDCTQLREVVLNEGLKKIGVLAFDGCELLESITLPSTVTDIGNAFCDCTKLREVAINDWGGCIC